MRDPKRKTVAAIQFFLDAATLTDPWQETAARDLFRVAEDLDVIIFFRNQNAGQAKWTRKYKSELVVGKRRLVRSTGRNQ